MVEHFRLMFLQVLAAPVPAPAVSDTGLVMMIATFISQVKVNGFVAFVIQKMKDSKAPALNWISTNTPWVTRAVAAVGAAATAVGIHWTFSGGNLLITGLSLTTISTLAYNIAQNYLFQFAWYKQVFAPQPGTAAAPAVVGTGAGVAAPMGKGGAGVPGGD